MTEQQWLASDQPAEMLRYLTGPCVRGGFGADAHAVSERKLRLWACACCRQVPFTESRSRDAIHAAERFAEGQAAAEEIQTGSWFSQRLYEGVCRVETQRLLSLVRLVGGGVHRSEGVSGLPVPAADAGGQDPVVSGVQAALLRDVIGNPFRSPLLCRLCNGRGRFNIGIKGGPERGPEIRYIMEPPTEIECHECQGKGTLPAAWRTPTVRAIAEAAYSERGTCPVCKGKRGRNEGVTHERTEGKLYGCRWITCSACGGTGKITDGTLDADVLGVLADKLEEDGCEDPSILGHLRGREPCPCCLSGWVPRTDGRLGADLCRVCSKPPHFEPRGWLASGPHVRGCAVIDALTGRS